MCGCKVIDIISKILRKIFLMIFRQKTFLILIITLSKIRLSRSRFASLFYTSLNEEYNYKNSAGGL